MRLVRCRGVRPTFWLAVALTGLLAGGCGESEGVEVETTGEIPAAASPLFVVRGSAETDEARISIEADTVEWFSDRPERLAGVSDTRELADRWGELGFEKVPPNAALAGGEVQAVVELSDPQFEDGEISFAYEPIGADPPQGDLPDLSVFIDDAGLPEVTTCAFTLSRSIYGGFDLWLFSTNGDPTCADQEEITDESFIESTKGNEFIDPPGQISGESWSCMGTVNRPVAEFTCQSPSGKVVKGTGSGTEPPG